MFICDDIEVIFTAVPKTGTRTMYWALGEFFHGRQQGDHVKTIPSTYNNYFSFTIKRNPYDRICSAYWHVCRRKGNWDTDRYGYQKMLKKSNLENTLENYLSLIQIKHGLHNQPQWPFYENNKFNAIIEFDNIQAEFNQLPFVQEPIELCFANTTTKYREIKCPNPREHWTKMMTPKAYEIVNKLYKEDFELLGYEMIKP